MGSYDERAILNQHGLTYQWEISNRPGYASTEVVKVATNHIGVFLLDISNQDWNASLAARQLVGIRNEDVVGHAVGISTVPPHYKFFDPNGGQATFSEAKDLIAFYMLLMRRMYEKYNQGFTSLKYYTL